MNVLEQWAKENKAELQAEKERKEKQGKQCRTIEGETIVVIKDIKKVTDSTFEFAKSDGTMQKVKRYFYHMTDEYNAEDANTWPLLLPKTVHYDIVDYVQEYGTKLRGVKITKTGSGKDTEYKTYPQLA